MFIFAAMNDTENLEHQVKKLRKRVLWLEILVASLCFKLWADFYVMFIK